MQRPTRTAPPGRRRRERSADETGAVSAEQVGIAAVVAAVIAAMFVVPIAPTVFAWGSYAVCSLFGGECERPLTMADLDGTSPEHVSMACLEHRVSESGGGSLTLFSVQVNGDLGYQIDRNSDGSHTVTLDVSGGLAADLVAGGKLDADALGIKHGKTGAVEAGIGATVSPVYTFGSEAEAVAFAEQARDLVAGPVDDLFDLETLIPFYGPGRIGWNQYQRVTNFDPPDPSRVRIEGDFQVEASGSLRATGGGLDGLLGAGRALGVDIDLETGDQTFYVALDQRLAGELGIGPSVVPIGGNLQPGGEVSGETVLALTTDRSLTPIALELGVTLSGHGGFTRAQLEGVMFDGAPFGALAPDLDDAIAELGIGARSDAAFALSATGGLDLTDPALGTFQEDLFAALRSRDAGALARAGGDLGDHLLRQSNLEAQLHTGSQDALDLSAKGGKALAFGFGVSHSSSEMSLAGAWHRPPGGFFARAHCG